MHKFAHAARIAIETICLFRTYLDYSQMIKENTNKLITKPASFNVMKNRSREITMLVNY